MRDDIKLLNEDLKYTLRNLPVSDDLQNRFSYHAPKEGQPETYESIRDFAKLYAHILDELVPNSREKSLALTKLEEAVFWANAGVSRS